MWEKRTVKGDRRKRKALERLFVVLMALTLVSGCVVAYDLIRTFQREAFWKSIRATRDEGFSLKEVGERKAGDILPQYRELYARNQDMAGWLQIAGAKIDCPVMHTRNDPEYYLRRDFDRREDASGTAFVDFRCSIFPRRSFNLIIYGHYTDGDRLFRRMLDYAYEDWAVENKLFRFDTLEEEGSYEVVAAFYYDGAGAALNLPDQNEGENAYTFYNYIELDSEEGFQRFRDELEELSLYQAGVNITPKDELLTIVCCAPEPYSGFKEEGRFVVVAKRVG